MIMRRRIVMTEDDMMKLRALVRRGRVALHRDRDHLGDLERELEHANVVATGDMPPDVVTLHTTVRVRDVKSGTSKVYTVVVPGESDPATGRLSVLAPIGTALIGYRVGDEIEWRTPGGMKRLRIEAVLFQPEAEGEIAASARRSA